MDKGYKPTYQNIYYLAYLIETISRKTKNTKKDLATYFDRDLMLHICDIEDVYHSLPMDRVVGEFIEELDIREGNDNRIAACRYRIPAVKNMAGTYARLASKMESYDNILDNYIKILNSDLCEELDDYNSSFFFENSDYVAACFDRNVVLDMYGNP